MPARSDTVSLARWFPERPRFQAPRNLGLYEIYNCLDENGDLIDDHPDAMIVEQAEASSWAYIERTLDGTGLVVIGRFDDRYPYKNKDHCYTPIGGNFDTDLSGWRLV